MAAIKAATMLLTTQAMPRAERGIGALAMAVDGHWNSRMAGKVGSASADRRRTTVRALDVDWLVMGASRLGPGAASRRRGAVVGYPNGGSVVPIAAGRSYSDRAASGEGRYR